jgi:hypothetical protein
MNKNIIGVFYDEEKGHLKRIQHFVFNYNKSDLDSQIHNGFLQWRMKFVVSLEDNHVSDSKGFTEKLRNTLYNSYFSELHNISEHSETSTIIDMNDFNELLKQVEEEEEEEQQKRRDDEHRDAEREEGEDVVTTHDSQIATNMLQTSSSLDETKAAAGECCSGNEDHGMNDEDDDGDAGEEENGNEDSDEENGENGDEEGEDVVTHDSQIATNMENGNEDSDEEDGENGDEEGEDISKIVEIDVEATTETQIFHSYLKLKGDENDVLFNMQGFISKIITAMRCKDEQERAKEIEDASDELKKYFIFVKKN